MVGEHIRTLKGGRWVHAIDCGDETVLHLAEDAAPRRVRRAYRPEFVAGAEAVESVTHRERTFPPAEVVRRAYSRAADPTLAVMFRDSQAFAEWCTTGRLPGPANVAVEVPAPPAAAAPASSNGGIRAGAQRKPAIAKASRAVKAAPAKARPAAKTRRTGKAKRPAAAPKASRGGRKRATATKATGARQARGRGGRLGAKRSSKAARR
jgi:hypothetical protein